MTERSQKVAFSAVPYVLEGQLIVRLPESASKQLPSRGQVAVVLTYQDTEFLRVIEPDGNWGHWLRIDDGLQAAGVSANSTITMTLTPSKNWPEPIVPTDIAQALDKASQKVKDKWRDITPMARWEWVRWINATKNPDTRTIRIEKTISKLDGTHRRPCCFNLAACTDTALAKNGRLIGVV